MAYTPEIGRRFWYEFDNATKYNDSFINIISDAGAFGVQDDLISAKARSWIPIL
jgi:hypothetical protein